jgi:hypothetical protein
MVGGYIYCTGGLSRRAAVRSAGVNLSIGTGIYPTGKSCRSLSRLKVSSLKLKH